MQWLRLYDDALDDPKVQRLSPELFKHWVNVLCLANKGTPRGALPGAIDIAFRLRLTEEQAIQVVAQLAQAGLLVRGEAGWKPHNWDQRQFSSDDVNARVKAHRQRNVTRNVTPKNHETLHVTPPDTDTDTDTEQNRAERAGADAPPKPKTKRATAMTDAWEPDAEIERWAMTELGMKIADINAETCKFRDHFTANGKPMKDWDAAWRNWMRRSREFGPARASPSNGTKPEERRPRVPRFESMDLYKTGGGG